jgi:ubiquitin carboxyl-terminal hydrolase 34
MCETPNVLIVHLQRLLFDFDTFRNEKMNQHFEFPSILDLKDYSYHEVMRREKQEPVEDAPILDDCWEYKLVGVNVHSGSANAGHYWSYINTVRGKDERDDNTWVETEKDQWMEFNDSTVRDYKFDNLFGECFGDKQSAQPQVSAWGYEMNTSTYGKSAYMLIYERR